MFKEIQNIIFKKKHLSKKQRECLSNIILDNPEHWKWRYSVAEYFAKQTNFDRYNIKAIYLIGSVKNACAGPGSDIDLLVHLSGNEFQKKKFKNWVAKWSDTISYFYKFIIKYEINDGLIDLHIITDVDIKNKTSFAIMIGAVTDPARLLKS